MKKNIFVLGLEPFNRDLLESLPRAHEYTFHPLLTYQEIRGQQSPDIGKLLETAEKRLQEFTGSIDAIIGYFDFPVTNMVPILCRKYGLPAASLESVIKCEHKFWSRIEQKQVIPDHIPYFEPFDPFNDGEIHELSLLFPYWIKPIKSFRSFLAFRINDEIDLENCIAEIRTDIHSIAKPFNYILDLVTLPEEITSLGGRTCIAESLLSGSQCTLEGYVYNHRVHIYGVVDSVREADRSSFSRYEYPSQLPESVQTRMKDITARIMNHIGFNNATFNIEFFYNQTEGTIYLLEINPRISQSHADLFKKVKGSSHHTVMIDLALGQEPTYRLGSGEHLCAAKFMLRHFEDAVVTAIPEAGELKAIEEEMPGTLVDILVQPGTRLSKLKNQDSYSYELADIYIGGENQLDLLEKYNRCVELLTFQFEPSADAYQL